MSSEIDLIYREWQEAIRDRFNIKGEQVVVAKPSNPAHLSILKEMCLGAGFTTDQANSIVLIETQMLLLLLPLFFLLPDR